MGIGHVHDHGHAHSHAPSQAPLKPLVWALTITAVIFFAQLVGALVSGSLALLSDSMHMLSDSTGLILALLAAMISRRAATAKATYGYRRVEVLAALVNGIAVTGVTVWIVVSAIGRVTGGLAHDIDSLVMGAVAVVGLVANLASAWILSRHQEDSINIRAAFLHVLADLLGSVFVIIAAVVIATTGFIYADTIASLMIVILVVPRALRLLRDALNVLLERVPDNLDTAAIHRSLEAVEGVEEIHDLHVWSTDGTAALATCHAVVDKQHSAPNCGVLDELQAVLASYGIEHSTVQIEYPGHYEHEQVCD